MGKMYHIARYIPMTHPHLPGALNGEEEYHGIEKAKIAMRRTVVEKFGGPESYLAKIDEYCQKYYPDNTPPEFLKLKSLLTNLLTDPTFPKSQEELEKNHGWFDFEDERIHFTFSEEYLNFIEETGDMAPTLQINLKVDDEEIFLHGYITCFVMNELPDDEWVEYRCWLSAGVYRGLDICMSLAEEDEL